DGSLADDTRIRVVDGNRRVLDDDLEEPLEYSGGPLKNEAAVPFIFVQTDRQGLRVRLEVFVRPSENDVGAGYHCCEHRAIRDDRRRRRRREQCAACRNAGNWKKRKFCALENRRRIVEMLHSWNVLLGPGKS